MEEERIDPGHQSTRGGLRGFGGVLLAVGALLLCFGVYRMFSPAWTDHGNPSEGFMEGRRSIDEVGRRMHDDFRDDAATSFSGFAMVAGGMICLAVGGVLLKMGYMGRVARYVAGEVAPVASDTVNYVAGSTRQGVHDVAEAVASGIHDALHPQGAAPAANTAVASQTDKFCRQCGARSAPSSHFCGECGKPLA
jgi:hypothetical protein